MKHKKHATEELGKPPPIELFSNLVPNCGLRGHNTIDDHVVPVPPDAPENQDDS
jgi:hypothetical protein